MSCVCGHDRDDHRPVVLSVPLPPKPGGPNYRIEGTPAKTYNGHRPTCEGVACHCGCSTYLQDSARCSLLNTGPEVDSGTCGSVGVSASTSSGGSITCTTTSSNFADYNGSI